MRVTFSENIIRTTYFLKDALLKVKFNVYLNDEIKRNISFLRELKAIHCLKTLVMPDFKDHCTVRPGLPGHGTTRATIFYAVGPWFSG